jgi:alkanesulfonate monooxygenase SsuD/methylene tetrahydromethanopterin reductase-like flavin-dependent oxidoreductase (luciferase family)/hemerythrin-like domain-containing protein
MTDYGHELQFGTFLTPSADNAAQILELAQLTELVGLELVTIQDHPYQARHLDTWTLLSVIAARTSTLRVAPNVANLPLRQPVVLARSVASLDILSGGRVELGLGAGAFWDAIAALGGPRRSPGEAVAALEEAIDIIRAAWDVSQRSIRHEGVHYRVKGAHPGPRPAHRVEIWLGAYKPRMLALTGAKADGWLPSLGYAAPEALPAMNAAIDEAAVAAGRNPADIRRLYNINGRFGSGRGFLAGDAEDWAEQIAELALTLGMSTFILGSDDPDTIRRFATEVVPAVREIVDAERGDPVVEAPSHGSPNVASGVLAVRPTPDDGTRLSSERAWDEGARPSGPAPDSTREYTADQQAAAQHLVDVHDALRAELAQLRDLVEQVEAGNIDAGRARSLIHTMTLRQNNWTLGAYCASYCRIVTGHHTLEDRRIFPHLRRSDARLGPVLDRLEQEHHVIAGLLDRIDNALVELVTGPDGLTNLRAAVDLLADAMQSHLAYEERELIEPLARFGFY